MAHGRYDANNSKSAHIAYADLYQASILRQIIAGPRNQHAETGLDLCYVTDKSVCSDFSHGDNAH